MQGFSERKNFVQFVDGDIEFSIRKFKRDVSCIGIRVFISYREDSVKNFQIHLKNVIFAIVFPKD